MQKEKNSAKKRRQKKHQEKAVRAHGLRLDTEHLDVWRQWKLSMRFPEGVYKDMKFLCIDCGAFQVWKARQQKWWFEVAQGDPDSTAVRCRECRVKERQRIAEVRREHQEGLERKRVQQSEN